MKAEAPGSEASSNSVGGALEDSSMVHKVQLMTMDQQNKTQKCVIFTPRFRPQILDADTNWITWACLDLYQLDTTIIEESRNLVTSNTSTVLMEKIESYQLTCIFSFSML